MSLQRESLTNMSTAAQHTESVSVSTSFFRLFSHLLSCVFGVVDHFTRYELFWCNKLEKREITGYNHYCLLLNRLSLLYST